MLLPLAPVSLIVQLFDAFLAFSLLFGSFLLYVQEGSAASIQVDMQIEAAARLKSTVSDLPALEISRNISFGAPRAYSTNRQMVALIFSQTTFVMGFVN